MIPTLDATHWLAWVNDKLNLQYTVYLSSLSPLPPCLLLTVIIIKHNVLITFFFSVSTNFLFHVTRSTSQLTECDPPMLTMTFTHITANRVWCAAHLPLTNLFLSCPQSRTVLLLQFSDSSVSLPSLFFRLLQQNSQKQGKQGWDKNDRHTNNQLTGSQTWSLRASSLRAFCLSYVANQPGTPPYISYFKNLL